MNSAFKNISDTNSAFGNLFGICIAGNKVINVSKLKTQAENLYDELLELKEDGFDVFQKAASELTIVDGTVDLDKMKTGRLGMIDALGDLLVFLYGIPHFLGVDYVESSVDEKLKVEIQSYDEKSVYSLIYDDIKTLIDNLIASITNEEGINAIIAQTEKLDSYLLTVASIFGVDMTGAIQEITNSNMSKLCKDENECNDTLKFYTDKGVDVYSKESPLIQESGKPFLVVYSSSDQEVQGKVYRAHKFLKCVNWSEPDLTLF